MADAPPASPQPDPVVTNTMPAPAPPVAAPEPTPAPAAPATAPAVAPAPPPPAPVVLPDPTPAPAATAVPAAPTATQKDTDVVQEVVPPVTHETVNSTEQDVDKTVVDKELHEDVYHTTVQTIIDNKQLPEQVYSKIAPTEERNFDERGDPKELEQHLADEAAKYRDERVVNETRNVHTVEPTVTGEHVHYHVHERVQPIVQREVIQPTVVHTTMPVHETYHHHPHFTATTSLPPVSMSDFKQHGGTLGTREPYHDQYEGEPRSDSGEMADTAPQLYQK